MSDVEETPAVVEVEEVVDLESAVRRTLKHALAVDGLSRGLHEAAKAIEAGNAKCVFLSESCDEPTYKKLVQGLCLERSLHMVNVPDTKKLGEWAGLCKIDSDGLPRKVVGASCVVVTDFGEENDGLAWLQANEFNK
eukprot:GEMP01122450.1.p1 GENE.GEMP01122450.1~~GEMP01122450.1.p1  ORF type:complete len:137 (+),score=37.61 GEMP01122450.1:64-474(+)